MIFQGLAEEVSPLVAEVKAHVAVGHVEVVVGEMGHEDEKTVQGVGERPPDASESFEVVEAKAREDEATPQQGGERPHEVLVMAEEGEVMVLDCMFVVSV